MRGWVAGVLLGLVTLAAGAAEPLLLVPFAPKGEADSSAQLLVQALRRQGLDAPRIEHRVGDSGAQAALDLKRAAADGRTLMVGRVGNIAILPALKPELGYGAGDFETLAVLDLAPLICAVRADSPLRTLRELLLRLTAPGAPLRYSTAGAGTIQSLSVRYLQALQGLPPTTAQPQHFEQGGQATQALLDGRVDFSCNNARSLLPLIAKGELRGLMTTAPGRLKQLPQLQNAAELGLRDLQQLQGWSVLMAPKGLPPAARQRLREQLKRVAEDPEWQAGTEALGSVAALRLVRDPQQFVRQQARLYERLARGLEPTQ